MLLNSIFEARPPFQVIPEGAQGRWYIATDLLSERRLEELNIQGATGATILAARRGLCGHDPNKEDVELFLWGTAQQLALAQEQFKLQCITDALLNLPEIYWG